MTIKLVMIGASGHSGHALGDLGRLPQVAYAAYAPSFPGEDTSRLVVPGPDGDLKRYDDWREMLASESPDIVGVTGRYDLNGPIGLAAVQSGAHVLSDKPAGHSLDEIAALRRAVVDAGVHYSLMLNIRYWPAYWTARQVVTQGLIGRPYLISGQKSYRWGDSRPEFYANRAHYGSSMTWIGIHAFDYARWVSGVDYTQVFGYHGNLVRKDRPGCQDVSTVIASLANGGSAVFSLDYLRPGAALTHGDDRLRIAGSRGVLEVCDEGTRLHVITEERDEPNWPLVDPGRSLMGDLVAAIEGRGELLVTAEQGFSISEFAVKAALAADTGRAIPA